MALEGQVRNLNDAIIRSVQYEISVNGAGALTDFQARLANVQAAQALLTAKFNAGKIEAKEYQEQLDKLTMAERDLEGRINLTTAAMANGMRVTDDLVDKIKKAEGQAQKTSYAFFQIAYAIDDVQYGLPALTNNIVGLTTAALGNSQAVAGIAVGLVAAVAIYNNWNAIVSAGKGILLAGIPATQSAQKEMEALGKVTEKTADQQERFNKLKEDERLQNKITAIRGKAEQAHEKAVADAFEESGGDKAVREGLVKVELGSNRHRDMQEEERIAEGRKVSFKDPLLQRAHEIEQKKREKAYDDKRMKAANEAADAQMREAMRGEPGLASLISTVDANNSSFNRAPGLLGSLMGARREDRERQAGLEVSGEIRGKKLVEDRNKREQQENKARQEADAESRRKQGAFDLNVQHRIGQMAPGLFKEHVQGADLDRDKLKKRMMDAGLPEAEVDEIVDAVLAGLMKQFSDKLVAHAMTLGQGATPKTAMEDLRRKAQEESQREAELAEKKQGAAASKAKAAQARLDKAHDKGVAQEVRKLKPEAKKILTPMIEAGADPLQMRKFIRGQLEEGGRVKPEFIDDAVEAIVGEAEEEADAKGFGRDLAAGMAQGGVRAAAGPPKGMRVGAGGGLVRETRGSRLRAAQAARGKPAMAPNVPGTMPVRREEFVPPKVDDVKSPLNIPEGGLNSQAVNEIRASTSQTAELLREAVFGKGLKATVEV
jgi:hypothetical protein